MRLVIQLLIGIFILLLCIFLVGLIQLIQDVKRDPNHSLESMRTLVSAAGLGLSAIGFVVTSYFLVANYKNNIRSNSAKMVADLSHRLDSNDMRQYRTQLAKQLIAIRQRTQEARTDDRPLSYKLADDAGMANDVPLLDFLEDIGYLTKAGVLDADMVWNSFVWVVERYYLAMTTPHNLLEEMRAGSYPELYERFEWLYATLFDIDRRKRPRKSKHDRSEQSGPPRSDCYSPTYTVIDRFLIDESKLTC